MDGVNVEIHERRALGLQRVVQPRLLDQHLRVALVARPFRYNDLTRAQRPERLDGRRDQRGMGVHAAGFVVFHQIRLQHDAFAAGAGNHCGVVLEGALDQVGEIFGVTLRFQDRDARGRFPAQPIAKPEAQRRASGGADGQLPDKLPPI